jgi:hypothetical protein
MALCLSAGGAASAEPPAAPPAPPAASQGPSAEQKETARALMDVGDKKFDAGDYRAALEAYQGADAIMQLPPTGLAVGKARARLGLLVEAVDVLQRTMRHPKQPNEAEAVAQARDAAARLDADLARRIPTLQIVVKGPAEDTPVDVRVDGAALEARVRALPRRLNPGEHVVVVTAPGYFEATEKVTLVEGERRTVEIALRAGAPPPPIPTPPPDAPRAVPPPPPPEEPTVSPVAWVGFGIGGAGLVVGAVTGALSLSKQGSLEDECPGNVCPESKRGEHDEIVALANVSNVAFGIGAVGVGVGIVSLVLSLSDGDEQDAPRSASGTRVEPLVGVGSVGLRGAF